MDLRCLIVLLWLLCLPIQIFASDSLFDFLIPDDRQMNALIGEAQIDAGNLTKTDVLNQFYAHCVSLNDSRTLDIYAQEQCACTAARMQEVMSLDDIVTMNENGNDADFQAGRLIFLAYAPCLSETAGHYVYESCIGTGDVQDSSSGDVMCECVSENMESYLAGFDNALIPGFNERSMDKTRSVSNPLSYVLQTKGFQMRLKYYQRTCLLDYNYRG